MTLPHEVCAIDRSSGPREKRRKQNHELERNPKKSEDEERRPTLKEENSPICSGPGERGPIVIEKVWR